MKWYIAYRFTGEDSRELRETLKYLCDLLVKKKYNNYCSFFDKSIVNIGNKNVIKKAFKKIDASDSLLVFIKSEEKSKGMLIEIGYALAKKKKIFLLIKRGIKTGYIREVADKIIEFDNLKELKKLGVSFLNDII